MNKETTQGMFWGIGVGPGDSDLLTVKVVKSLKRLDVLYTPTAHKGQASLAETIAQPYLPMGIDMKERHFPMTNDKVKRAQALGDIAQEMLVDIANGKNVGMLTLGDPAIYSTVSYIVELIRGKAPIRLLAGIASYSQLAATLGYPLMIDDESLCILSATDDITKIAHEIDANDNLIIMKIKVKFSEIYAYLEQQNLLDHAIVVSDISMGKEQQQRLDTMSGTETLPYFATLLIKKRVQLS